MIRPVSVTPIALPRIMMLHTLNRFRLISQAALLPGRRARMSEPLPPLRYSDSRSRAPLEPPSRETPLWRTHTSGGVRPVALGADCDRAGPDLRKPVSRVSGDVGVLFARNAA